MIGEGALLRLSPTPLSSRQIFKDDVNGFPSTSDIYFMIGGHASLSNYE